MKNGDFPYVSLPEGVHYSFIFFQAILVIFPGPGRQTCPTFLERRWEVDQIFFAEVWPSTKAGQVGKPWNTSGCTGRDCNKTLRLLRYFLIYLI
jgi:hypothetical protein